MYIVIMYLHQQRIGNEDNIAIYYCFSPNASVIDKMLIKILYVNQLNTRHTGVKTLCKLLNICHLINVYFRNDLSTKITLYLCSYNIV